MQSSVAVRALCEFTAKAGDLDLRFTPAPTALEGIAGHAAVTASRAGGYEREIALEGRYEDLLVRGRADGYDPARNRLEEIKTHRGDLSRQPANHRHLHWAQAKVYGALLCEARGLDALQVALVYFDVGTQKQTVLEQAFSRDELRAFFETQCARFLGWARQERAHRCARDAALAALAFPHPQFRDGQRELAENAWRAASQGRCLLAQAPTGIGKTLGTLFPVLKAAPASGTDKVFYLAAKTTGRQLALDATGLLTRPGRVPLRVLELVARDKACEHPDKACHGESCPLARGFYDRLPAARDAAVAAHGLAAANLREVARTHAVCPYYLAQDLVRWADVVVGDYNYFFDGGALLHAAVLEHGWRAAILVDEAHNLVERGRAMYSAQLDPAALRAARQAAPPAVRRALDRLRRAWSSLADEDAPPHAILEELPADWLAALHKASAAISEHFEDAPHEPPGALRQFHFDVLAMLRLVESFGPHSMAEVTLRRGARGTDAIPGIRNVIPAPFLQPRFVAAQASVLFSATLQPARYYADLLGLPADTVCIDVGSPFRPEQLDVRIVRRISTRWADRGASLEPIAGLIAAHYRQRPGNYLAFFSSFDYMQQVAQVLRTREPELPVEEQARAMTEGERLAFLERFVPGGQRLGFAVLGGSFGEGIDLPGDRLVGAFIATLGLPQVNATNEAVRERMAQAFGSGYDYTYLYPGLRKVVQAAGRVIRTRDDTGTVLLIDDRFARSEVRALLPSWWHVRDEERARA
jgi:Rad3-related DNA helicase